MTKYQFWQNGIMMGLVDDMTKRLILINSEVAGFKITDNGHYFTVETNINTNLKEGIIALKEEMEEEIKRYNNRIEYFGQYNDREMVGYFQGKKRLAIEVNRNLQELVRK